MSELESNASEESVPFYPDHVGKEAKVVLGFTLIAVLIGLVGLFLPVGLGEPADPLNTPAHVKPEWYFLALYQLLKYIPKNAGAVLPVIAVIVLTIWPFIDRKPDQSVKNYKSRTILVSVTMIVLIVITIWGEVS